MKLSLLPPPPPADLRRRRRPGARRPHAAQRGRAGQGPPRLPVRRLARHRQDVDGEDPRRAALNCERRADGRRPAASASRAWRSPPATSLDVIEMDAASNNSVDDIRDLRERVAYAPVGGPLQGLHPRRGAHAVHARPGTRSSRRSRSRRRTRSSCSPPPRPHKVLPTIVDRCHRFDFQRPVARADRRRCCAGSPTPESIEIDDGAVALIARSRHRQLPRRARHARAARHLRRRAGSRSTTCSPCSASPTPSCSSAPSTRSPPRTPRAALEAVERLAALRAATSAQFARDLHAHLRQLLVIQTLGEVPDDVQRHRRRPRAPAGAGRRAHATRRWSGRSTCSPRRSRAVKRGRRAADAARAGAAEGRAAASSTPRRRRCCSGSSGSRRRSAAPRGPAASTP